MNHLIQITKSDGTKQLFEEEKLVSSLKRVGAPIEAIEAVVDEIEKTMHEGMSTSEIYSKAFSLLRAHSHPVAVKYSVRRALLELGPDGFPFEKLVARIFRMWGYETLTDQILKGDCVEHEMDVVAWKGDSLAMVEAKYHHESGLKSDVKVALYVKARFDDLASQRFTYGGVARMLTERWLFTNTKFSDPAITYGTFHGLKMVGWNFPAQGNLHDILENNGLHPVTCITSLTPQQKRDLIGRNILVCVDVVSQPNILSDIGVKGADAQKVLDEAKLIVAQAK